MEEETADPMQQLAVIREAAEQRHIQFEFNEDGPDTAVYGGKIGVLQI